MKRLALMAYVVLLLLALGAPLYAGEKPDIIHYTAQYLDRALHVTLQWQSTNPITLVRISAGREAKEVKVDEYDNHRVEGGYTGEVTVNIPVEAAMYQKDVSYVLQLEDDLRLKSELVTGKAQLPVVASPYGPPMGGGMPQQDTWGQDHLKPTPKSQGGAGTIVDKLIELKDKFDLAPSIAQIKPNVTGPNNVTFSLKANDDKQLREINIKVFDAVGNMVQNQQITGLGRVWEGTSQVFTLSGGTYRVIAQAVDSAGNTSKEVTASFEVKGGPVTAVQPLVTSPTTPAVDQPSVAPTTTPTVTQPPVVPSPPAPVVDQPPTIPPSVPIVAQPPVVAPPVPAVEPPPVVPPPVPVVDQPSVAPPPAPITVQPPVVAPPVPVVEPPPAPIVVPPPVVPSCPVGQALCAGLCSDLQANTQNCGACGRVCAQGLSCVNGVCIALIQPPPVGELIQNGDFSRGASGWTYETWYQQASPAGEVNFGQPRVTFKGTTSNSRVGIMQPVSSDVSGCRNLMLKAVVRAEQQTLSGTGYGGREAAISVFVGYVDATGVERTQNGSLANPVEPQNRQMFWNGFYYMDPTGLSTTARGTKVQQGQWYSYVVDLMAQSPKPKQLRFVGAEGAGWPTRSGALHQISLTCNGDATPLSAGDAPGWQTQPVTGTQLLQPPSDPVIYGNGNIAGVQNGPRIATTFNISAPYKVTWIYTYHYFNGGKLPGTISLRHSDGTVYGPFKADGAVGQGNVANAYWFVRPNVEIKAGNYTVIDSDAVTWSHNSGSSFAGFVELRGIRGTTQSTDNSLQTLQPPNDPIIVDIGNIAGVQNAPTKATIFTLSDSYLLTFMYDYHYFNNGVQPGTIALRHSDGTVYGPWQALGAVGQGNVPNAYWFVRPSVLLKPGTYQVIDSHPATWSHNSGTQGAGFVRLWGIKQSSGTYDQSSAGVWDTSEGVLTFIQSGSMVTGNYSQDNGKIDGIMTGVVLDGYWAETSSGQRCATPHNGNYYWGRIHFVFSGNTFSGAWGYCDANPDHSWTGKKR